MEMLSVIAIISDVDKVCRTCLSVKEEVQELCYLYNNNLHVILWELVGCSKPILGDGLPGYICKRCVEQLDIAFTFKEQCQKSELRLRNLLLTAQSQKFNTSLKELLSNDFENECASLKDNLVDFKDFAIQKDVCGKQEKNNTSSIQNLPNDELCVNESNKQEIPVSNIGEVSLKSTTKCKSSKNTAAKIFKCEHCTKAFRSAAGLRMHSVTHGIKLSCQVCDKKFVLMKQLNKHMRLHKDYKPYTCKLCKKSFSTRGYMWKHMRIHGGEKKHLCITCGRRFFEHGNLAIHMRTHTGEKPMVCNVCNKRFADPHGLAAHNKIHTGERNYECKECGKRFAHSFVLTAHIRTHTGERPYQCSICGISYATSSYLTIHKRTHTQERPFKCESCPKAFVSRCALVAHNMIHTGEKKYQCNVCGKRVARAADLNIHLRSHTGEKPYCCDQCPKRYHTSSNLAAHKRTHSGIKSHVCSICEKAFVDARVLRGHLRIHTGEKPYVCQICGKQYSQSGQLAAHRKTHAQSELDSRKTEDPLADNIQQNNYNNVPQNSETCLEDNNIIYSHETVIENPVISKNQLISVMNCNKDVQQLIQDKLEMKGLLISENHSIPVLKLESCGLNTSNFYTEVTPISLSVSLNQSDPIVKTSNSLQ